MNQTAQTLKFAIAAAVSVVLAGGTWFWSQPNPVEGFGKVGQDFFPDLDVTKATALMVVEYDEDQATHRDFVVQKQGNIWRLHDYHDYPADGEEQLGKTITSLLGVTRGACRAGSKPIMCDWALSIR